MRVIFHVLNNLLIITSLILTTSCSSPPVSNAEVKAPSEGAVATVHDLATIVGQEILDNGGNAVDAAVAVSYALAVVFPRAGNLGGGGFMIMRKNDHKAVAIDFREKAPLNASRDMYLDSKGNIIPALSTKGALSVGVPGSVDGTLYALEKYGTMSRKDVLAPAIELARNGFILSQEIGGPKFTQFPETAAIFNKSDGSSYKTGERFTQRDLAKTLMLISEKGRDGFYKGSVADNIVRTIARHNGIINYKDLETYRSVERTPIRGTYRGYEIVSMPPPSSGGTCLIQALNMLENYNVSDYAPHSLKLAHLMIEIEKRVYADRAQYMGDTDFVVVPLAELISKSYAKSRLSSINPVKASKSSEITHGKMGQQIRESEETTHYSIVDKDGMMVSVTTTLNAPYGSYLTVEGSGFLLNNEMDDFSIKPGTPNLYGLVGGRANEIVPNKRMLSSMSPTIVVKDKKNFMAIGSPGGSTIITSVLQCIVNVIDHKMSLEAAITSPRFHHQWLPDRVFYEIERSKFSEEDLKTLQAWGHQVEGRKLIGRVQAVMIDPKDQTRHRVIDSRRDSVFTATK